MILLVLLTLVTAASAIDIDVPDHIKALVDVAKYEESLGTPGSPSRFWVGSDAFKGESKTLEGGSRDPDRDVWATYQCEATASEKGPVAFVTATVTGQATEAGTMNASVVSGVGINFDAVLVSLKQHAFPMEVPVVVKGKTEVWAQGHNFSAWEIGSAYVGINVFNRGRIVAEHYDAVEVRGTETRRRSAEYQLEISVPVGTGQYYYDMFQIVMWANARAEGGVRARWTDPYQTVLSVQDYSYWASAKIDPEIFVDPTWEYAEDFVFLFSPNVEPVPEPATLALLLLGGLALLSRRRK